MIGEDALVPPTWTPPGSPKVSNTKTPVFGSATAETSETAFLLQFVRLDTCQDGLVTNLLQPPPAPSVELVFQSVSLPLEFSVVPPPPITVWQTAGYSTPRPPSPELAVTATLEC